MNECKKCSFVRYKRQPCYSKFHIVAAAKPFVIETPLVSGRQTDRPGDRKRTRPAARARVAASATARATIVARPQSHCPSVVVPQFCDGRQTAHPSLWWQRGLHRRPAADARIAPSLMMSLVYLRPRRTEDSRRCSPAIALRSFADDIATSSRDD